MSRVLVWSRVVVGTCREQQLTHASISFFRRIIGEKLNRAVHRGLKIRVPKSRGHLAGKGREGLCFHSSLSRDGELCGAHRST